MKVRQSFHLHDLRSRVYFSILRINSSLEREQTSFEYKIISGCSVLFQLVNFHGALVLRQSASQATSSLCEVKYYRKKFSLVVFIYSVIQLYDNHKEY